MNSFFRLRKRSVPILGLSLLALLILLFPRIGHTWMVPEKLVYELSWTGVKVGTATQEISQQGETRRIVSTARSNDWLSLFFPVDDLVESTLSVTGAPFPGLTRQHRIRMKEGKRSRDRETIFDQDQKVAHYIDHMSGERKDVPIPSLTFDAYASFYYVRHLPLEVGKRVSVQVFYGKEAEKLEVQVLRKEKIQTVLGKVNTIVIMPMVKSKGVFEGKGEVKIWLTDDERRIPVKAQTKVTVGSVTANLIGGTY